MTASADALAELGHRLGRRLLAQVATLVTPDTILRHRFDPPVGHSGGRQTRRLPLWKVTATALAGSPLGHGADAGGLRRAPVPD